MSALPGLPRSGAAEALVMACIKVSGKDSCVAFAGAVGGSAWLSSPEYVRTARRRLPKSVVDDVVQLRLGGVDDRVEDPRVGGGVARDERDVVLALEEDQLGLAAGAADRVHVAA